jgi:1-acyl-sn-glycerol-3-phosphate acyltransferase
MKRLFAKLLFWFMGWKVVGQTNWPNKCLVIAAPHTSNWDFLIGRCFAYIIGIIPKYLIKSEFFLPILGTLFRWNGGIPVYRNVKNDVVNQITELYNSKEKFVLGISPEGTRSKVDRWKTGFYHIAVNSKIPLLLLKMDYENKEIGIISEFHPRGNIIEDLDFIQSKFKDIKGKIPENYNPKIH